MKIDREQVKALVREELSRRVSRRDTEHHPALAEIHIGEPALAELEGGRSRPCLIEPDRPCYNSGYCKRLGY